MIKSKIALVMFGISCVVATWLTYSVNGQGTVYFDQAVTKFFTNIFSAPSWSFFKLITFLGTRYGIGIIAIALILWLWFVKRDYIGIVTVLIAVVVGNELNVFIKDIIKRPRPELEHLVKVNSYSFPSGHAMVGIILFMLIGYFLIRAIKNKAGKWAVGIFCGVMILLIGVSRIVLHVHYPSDILGGYAWGYVWIFVIISGYETISKRIKN